MEIYITTKNVYGNDLFYVKDPNQASVISRLTGRKTISRLDIDLLARLDVKVRVSEEAQEALGWTAEEAGAKAVNEADMEAWRKRCQI
jgi:histone H3/H4